MPCRFNAATTRSLKYPARFIELADAINSPMPGCVVERVREALNAHAKPVRGSRVLVCGVAYKRDVSDVRESPAFDVIHELESRGAKLSYIDPHVTSIRKEGIQLESFDPGATLADFDAVVIITDHSVLDRPRRMREAHLIVDTRDALGDMDGDRGRVFEL